MSAGCCPWWSRWHHRRLRDADRLFMRPILKRAVERHDGQAGTFSQAWDLFKAHPGQEHWHCACFAEETMANLRKALSTDG